jgi:hypothetical protein
MTTALPRLLLVLGFLMPVHSLAYTKGEATSASHQTVLALKPVGYWPADDGAGEILHDRSGSGNHGRILDVPWENGLLNFTGAYQWAEIPDHEQYQSRAFTIGGWVFNRGKIYGGAQNEGVLLFGNAFHRSGYRLETLYDSSTLYRKSEWGIAGGSEGGISLCLRRHESVDVISGGAGDAIGSRADGDAVAIGEWQHVLYAYEAGVPPGGDPQWQALQDWTESYNAGTGRLYVNGQLVQSMDGVSFKRRDMRFLIGADALWWLQSNRSGSLDGSIRDMVMFDRALTSDEIDHLHSATRPTVEPHVSAADAIVIDGKEISLDQLPAVSVDDRRRALEQLETRPAEELQPMSAELMAILVTGLKSPQTGRVAASLLMKLDDDEARAILAAALPLLVRETQDSGRLGDRAESVLALTEMGGMAKEAIPALVGVLEDIIEREGARLPHIEDLLRNSLMQALLEIDPDDEGVREVLADALAKPILDSIDLQQPYLEEVRPLVEAGRYMAALDIYRALPLKEHDDRFISQGDSHRDNRGRSGNERAYTATAEHGGYTYRLGPGKSFDAVEAVSEEEFNSVVEQLAVEYPEARDWMKGDTPRLSRVKIYKTDAAGNEQTAYLEGEHFIFDGRDAKVRGWSVAIDQDGYIHVAGGMHNAPNNVQYIPGSWEGMGASRDHTNDSYPTVLYWVSRNPGDIESLEYVGQRDNPRNMPAPLGMCYLTFTQDRDDVLYLYGRIHVQGIQSWALYRYDAEARGWNGVGGYAPNVTEEFPEWADQNIEMSADWLSLATFRWKNTAPQNQVLAWALQPHFYNYIRGWGIQFDRTNRMHVQVELFGFDIQNRNVLSQLYAYSDDGGNSFHRADGGELGLPLTVTPGEPGYAAMHSDSSKRWWDLWRSLLGYAGYRD